MDEKDKVQIILAQYVSYCRDKECFTDRNFTTNRFYMGLNLTLLLTTFLLAILTPSIAVVLAVSGIGLATCTMWWINIDTYRALIKIKYAGVIEKLEQELPVKPYRTEYEEFTALKNDKKSIIFADLQKFFTMFIFCIFLVVFVRHAYYLVERLIFAARL